jgi:hypothetical protein
MNIRFLACIIYVQTLKGWEEEATLWRRSLYFSGLDMLPRNKILKFLFDRFEVISFNKRVEKFNFDALRSINVHLDSF